MGWTKKQMIFLIFFSTKKGFVGMGNDRSSREQHWNWNLVLYYFLSFPFAGCMGEKWTEKDDGWGARAWCYYRERNYGQGWECPV